MSRTWTVYKKDSSFFVKGLPTISYHDEDKDEEDTMLLYFYPEGDVDYPYDKEKMLGSLYDLYQCEDLIKDGDRFETPFGTFFCWHVHVFKEEDYNEVMRNAWCPERLTLHEQKNLEFFDAALKEARAELKLEEDAKRNHE